MAKTAIEWATDTWNPFTGCDLTSPGCAYCYAKTQAESLKRRERGRVAKARAEGKPDPKTRYQRDGDPRSSGPGFGFSVHWDKIEKPPSFTRGGRVFVNSMSDLFHEQAPKEAIAAVFAAIAQRPATNFLILTKRPERMQQLLTSPAFQTDVTMRAAGDGEFTMFWPLPNVWLGVTIENRRFVDRADLLRSTPAAVRFISAEPLLGPLVFDGEYMEPGTGARYGCWADDSGTQIVGGRYGEEPSEDDSYARNLIPELELGGIDWLIVGGESGGPERRRLVDDFGPTSQAQEWVRNLRDACSDQVAIPTQENPDRTVPGQRRTAFFFKQWGGEKPTSNGRLLDGRTWDELPVPDGTVLHGPEVATAT